MRKGRVIAILCLSLILCFMCLITNTFSWFNRTEESGKSIALSNRTYKQSSGKDYTVKTYEMGNGDYTKEVDENKIRDLTISGGSRQCFKTEIMSNNASKQNVSLLFIQLSVCCLNYSCNVHAICCLWIFGLSYVDKVFDVAFWFFDR